MTLENLQVKPAEKKLVICLLPGVQSSIHSLDSDRLSLYIIRHGKIYYQFIKSLVAKHKQTIFIIQYNHNTSSTTETTTSNNNIEDVLNFFQFLYQEINSSQQYRFTSFSTIIMYDTAQYDKYQLTPQFIYIQQLLRYISLKHGMKIVSLRNMVDALTIGNIEQLLLTLDSISPIPILDLKGVEIAVQINDIDRTESNGHEASHNKSQINLYIPYTWDSWNKIVVQGKSIVLPNTDEIIIRNESRLEELDSNYEKSLSRESKNNVNGGTIVDLLLPQDYLQTRNKNKPKIELLPNSTYSLSDMLREIVQPSVLE